MSRSHSYSSNHSRGSRQYQAPNLAVTEASFQSLQLSDTSLPSTYSTSDRYSSRGSYGQESLNPTYLTPGYDAASYASASPSGSYVGSQRGVSPLASLEQEPSNYFDTEASTYGRADMSSIHVFVLRHWRIQWLPTNFVHVISAISDRNCWVIEPVWVELLLKLRRGWFECIIVIPKPIDTAPIQRFKQRLVPDEQAAFDGTIHLA
ncbi:MAG: hypothetical protein Q9218_005563 [Villophora microphyllina]